MSTHFFNMIISSSWKCEIVREAKFSDFFVEKVYYSIAWKTRIRMKFGTTFYFSIFDRKYYFTRKIVHFHNKSGFASECLFISRKIIFSKEIRRMHAPVNEESQDRRKEAKKFEFLLIIQCITQRCLSTEMVASGWKG